MADLLTKPFAILFRIRQLMATSPSATLIQRLDKSRVTGRFIFFPWQMTLRQWRNRSRAIIAEHPA